MKLWLCSAPILGLLLACGEGATTGTDAGGDPDDAGIVADSGVRALCPLPENAPACEASSACGAGSDPQSNCGFCRREYASMCLAGACAAPPKMDAIFEVRFVVGDLQPQVQSLVAIALAAETAGGLEISCEDVYQGRVNLDDPCQTVVQSRYRGITRQEQTYGMLFTRLPSQTRMLFVIYGFAAQGAPGQPIGISCVAEEVPGPDSPPVQVVGDRMRRIL